MAGDRRESTAPPAASGSSGPRDRTALEESLQRLQQEQRRQLQLLGTLDGTQRTGATAATEGRRRPAVDGGSVPALEFSRALSERTDSMMMGMHVVQGSRGESRPATTDAWRDTAAGGAAAGAAGGGRYFSESLASTSVDGGAVLPVLSCLHSALESTSAQHSLELLMWEGAWQRMCALVSSTIGGTKAATDAFKSNMTAMKSRLSESEAEVEALRRRIRELSGGREARDDAEESGLHSDREAHDEEYQRRMDDLRPLLERLHRTAGDAQMQISRMREGGGAGVCETNGAAGVTNAGTPVCAEPEKVDRALTTLNRVIDLYKEQTDPSARDEGRDARNGDGGGDDIKRPGASDSHAVDDIETASELVLLLFQQQSQQIDIMKKVITNRR